MLNPVGPPTINKELGIKMTPLSFSQPEPTEIDICFLCCTDVEEDALVNTLFFGETAHKQNLPPSRRRFFLNTIPYEGQTYSIVGTKASEMGNLDMLIALKDVYQHFRPRATLLIGIAGGLSDDLVIGDVVVADTVYQYERGKDTGEKIMRELVSLSMPKDLKNVVDSVRGDLRRAELADIKSGPYGTGEKVVAGELSEIRDYLTTVNRKVAAVEMESGGFYQYFQSPSFKNDTDVWLVIKGISDHANSQKSDSNQPKAAQNAVEAAIHLGIRVLESWQTKDTRQ